MPQEMDEKGGVKVSEGDECDEQLLPQHILRDYMQHEGVLDSVAGRSRT